MRNEQSQETSNTHFVEPLEIFDDILESTHKYSLLMHGYRPVKTDRSVSRQGHPSLRLKDSNPIRYMVVLDLK